MQTNTYAGLLFPRSGTGHKQGIVLGNLTGVIDPDYQGEIKISCWNRSEETQSINPGDRIAQLVFIPIARPSLNIVSQFDTSTARGNSGFGSTGK